MYSPIHALEGLYQTVTSQGIVLADTSPMSCTVEYTLLSICFKNVQNTWSWLIQPFADKPGKSFCQDAFGQGPCDAVPYCLLQYQSKLIFHVYMNWSGGHFMSFSQCTVYILKCTLYYCVLHFTTRLCLHCVHWVLSVSRLLAKLPPLAPSGSGK